MAQSRLYSDQVTLRLATADQMRMMLRQMNRLNETIDSLSYRTAHLEARAMSENIKPHEFVRQIVKILTDFNPDGDGTWPLRSSGLPSGFLRFFFSSGFLRFSWW